jgi:hypothetical protein
VYKHGEKDNYHDSEVTTVQGHWITVDYIFYRFVVYVTFDVWEMLVSVFKVRNKFYECADLIYSSW